MRRQDDGVVYLAVPQCFDDAAVGDGAAAAIVEKGSGRQGFHSFFMETHPEGFAHCEIRAGGTRRNPREGVDAKDFLGLLGIVWVNVHDNQMDIAETAHRDG